MADIKITADVSDLTKLIRTTNQTKTTVETLGRTFARSNDLSGYMRGINQVVTAQQRLAPAARMSRSEIMQLGATARQQALYLQELNRVTSQAGIGMNRYGVLTQQAGYQIGDFIVQVQSGTNAFVAFGQQATQVAGTLTLLGGKWILLGSVLGIVIPLVTAIGAAWMRTSGQGRTLEQTVQDLEQSLQGLSDTMHTDTADGVAEVTEEFGVLNDQVRRLIEQQQFLADMQFSRDLQDTVDALSGMSGGRWFDIGVSEQVSGLLALQSRFDITRQDAELLQEAFQAVAETDLGSEAQADALAQVASYLRTIYESRGQATQAELDALDAVLSTEAAIRRMLGLEESRTNLEEERERRAAERLERERQREQERRDATIASMEDELIILQDIIRYGEDSVEVATLRAIQAGVAAGFVDEELDSYVELALSIAEASQAIAEANREAERQRDIIEEIAGADFNSFEARVRALAQALGESADEARRLLDNLPVDMNYGRTLSSSDGNLLPPEPTSSRRSSGGGGGQGTSLTEIIANRERQISQEMELIRLGEQQARVREIELDLLRQYDGQVTSSVENEISAAAQRIAAREQELAQLERLRDAQESLADTIANSFEGMMMSIVDGTKTTSEAFRDMARAILAELYRVLVVQQIVGQIRSAVGGSGLIGNFMGSMLGLPGRASGGSIMAGQPYLVGERGPEIVVPSRSGTVMNNNLSSKVGGSQQVDVRVFVDDNGNFDAKVERISAGTVQKAAPKIIEGAKTAMVNTVQRGGSVARVFR